MGPLWRWISLRHLRDEGGRTLLTLLGVALGVAVYVAIRLANHSALASFSDTVDVVAGKANLQVVADSQGFDETVFPRIRALAGVRAAAPSVQVYALAKIRDRAPGPGQSRVHERGESAFVGETLLVLGLDPFLEEPFQRFRTGERGEAPPPSADGALSDEALALLTDPLAVVITRALAERHGLALGDPLKLVVGGRAALLNIRQILHSEEMQNALGGNVVLMDIAGAQEVLGRVGRLDRIDLIVDLAQRDRIRGEIQALLPAQARVMQPQGRTRQVENMLAAFELNLTALSFIALLVAAFMIFNAVSMAVLRRRREIGILRGLGLTCGQVIALFLSEAAILGVVGGLAGLALGTLMAQRMLGRVGETISALYLLVHVEHVVGDPAIYGTGFLLGAGVSVLAALAPALEAARTPPNSTVRQGMLLEARALPIRSWALAGLVVLMLAAGVAAWTSGTRQAVGGFASAFLILAGFSLLTPAFTLGVERGVAPLVRLLGGIEGILGARYLRDALVRTSVVVAALMVSVGMLVGLTLMVGSFRRTVTVWMDQTLKGDLYVEAAGSGNESELPGIVEQTARRLPGVAAVDSFRAIELTYQGRLTSLVGLELAVQERFGRLAFEGENCPARLQRARRESGALVTESFAHRFRVRVGDRLEIATPSGAFRPRVEGIFYDYSTDGGYILIDRSVLARYWKRDFTRSLGIYLSPGVTPDEARIRLLNAVPEEIVLYATPNRALRARALRIFDQTFQITYALQGIAILVSVLGIITSLTALIHQRGRELGILRAVGALRRQVVRMVVTESALLGLIGSLLGCICGVALAALLVYVINKQFFGWSIRFYLDPWLFAQTIPEMVVAAALAGIWPARLAASRVAAEAVRAE